MRIDFRRRTTPRLSVVVPIHNVAAWLPECLDSILRQPVGDLEIVLVDDASTDGSTAIAERYAAAYGHIRLIELPERSGVSTARNVGVGHCAAPYLTFVDSDDALPADAWSRMLRTLRRTGSDFVVGKAARVSDTEWFVPPLMQRNHEVERLRCTIEEAPLMLADVFVWNKIFRRDFWDRAGIVFPERTRYQDQPALTRAFLAAERFDVLTDVVYEWRMRHDLTSATQRRAELSNLEERRQTKLMTLEMVRRHGSQRLLDVLVREVLPIDMWEHYRAAVAGPSHTWDDAYWTLLRAMQTAIWNDATVPFEQTTIVPRQRAMGAVVEADRRHQLRAIIDEIDAGVRRGDVARSGAPVRRPVLQGAS